MIKSTEPQRADALSDSPEDNLKEIFAARLSLLKSEINTGGDVDVAKRGTELLCLAAYWGHQGAVNALVKAGAEINKYDETLDGGMELYGVASDNNLGLVKALEKAEAFGDYATKEERATPLWIADTAP
jgi:hypothetical protein